MPKRLLIFVLTVSVALWMTSCKEERSRRRLTPRKTTTSSSVLDTTSGSSEFVKRGISKKDNGVINYTDPQAGRSAKDFISQAKNLVIVVETHPPDWLEAFLAQMETNNLFLRALLLTSEECTGTLRGCQTVLGLKASFILVDDSKVLITPIYDTSTRGISYITADPVLVKAYRNFVDMILPSRNEN